MIHKLVALFSTVIVVGVSAIVINALLGQWAILFWIGAGFFGFLGIMAKINS